jgi:hypothetical protein
MHTAFLHERIGATAESDERQRAYVSRRSFGVAICPPLEWPWPSAQRRIPLPAQAQRREGTRFPDRAPFLASR